MESWVLEETFSLW